MRSTFWRNRIFEHQSCQFVTLAWNSLQNGQTVRFSWKLYKTLFSGHAQHVLAKSHLWASKFLKSSHWPQILFKTGKQGAFLENCTRRSCQFWPNRICEGQSSQNRHTGLKFSPKRENSALFMKIVQNARFRSCAARFGKIKFVSVRVLKIVTLASNSLKTGKQGAFLENCTKRSCQFWPNRICEGQSCQSRHAGLPKTGKQCAFHENCTNSYFQVMRSTFWPNRILERQSCQNRYTCLKFSSKRENSALFMKIVQNALFRSCAARFGQIAFYSFKVLKIVTLAWNSLQNKKTVRFPWKLYKTLFPGRAQHVLAKSHLWASKVSKSSHWPQILSKKGKQCAFHENCTNCSFQVTNSTFLPNRILERQSSQKRHTGLKSSSKREHNALFMKIVQNARFRSCAAPFGQIEFVRVKVVKIVTLASNSLQKRENSALFMKILKNPFFASCAARFPQIVFFRVKLLKILLDLSLILFKTGKKCAFRENCTKPSFSGHAQHVLAKWHFWASKLSNSHTGLKLSPKRENGALFMKIVQNARFRSYAARFGQIAFLSVKVVKIVTLARNSLQNGKTVRFP